MLNKKVYFLSGLPRTGSTLLGSILGQNPKIHATPTSPLYPLLVRCTKTFDMLATQHTYDHERVSKNVYHAMVKAFYANMQQSIIFDKHRWWVNDCDAIAEYINPKPRIICTVRPIAEIVTSYIALADKDENNFIDRHLRELKLPINNANRANLLWQKYIKETYDVMQAGLKSNPENILLVDYRDIVFHPQRTIDQIYDFCGIAHYAHRLQGIENNCAEAKDDAWGLKDLHTIRPTLTLKSENPAAYLPEEAIQYFNTFDVRVP